MKCKVLASVGLTLAVVAAAVVSTPAAAAAPDCQQVLLVGARGSSQQPADARELLALNDALKRNLHGLAYDYIQIGDLDRDLGLDAGGYPAVGMDDWFGAGAVRPKVKYLPPRIDIDVDRALLGDYYRSKDAGTEQAISFLNRRSGQCPSERYVLFGYSQGAQAMGDGFGSLSAALRRRIDFVAHFGDPVLKSPGPWNRGSATWPNGVLGGRPPYVPADLRDKTGAWCDQHDAVCAPAEAAARAVDDLVDELGSAVWVFDRKGFDAKRMKDALMSAHSHYADAGQEVTQAANEIAERLRRAHPEWTSDLGTTLIPIPSGTTKVDVAFVVDTTGSMWDDLDAAVASARTISGSILALPDARLKLVEYRDDGDLFQARTVRAFTRSAANFEAGLGELQADGGGDWRESVYSGLMEAFKGDWRPGALKLAIVIGDAPPHDPEGATGYRLADVLKAALELDPVVVNPIAVGGDTDTVAEFTQLAEGSGGKVYTTATATDLADAVKDAVDGFRRSPIASLVGPYPTAPNETLTYPTGVAGQYSAADSLDPDSAIERYDWDFTGDGIPELSGPEPSVQYTFQTSFEGLVSVTVHSLDGDQNTAVLPVRVSPAEDGKKAPSAPTGLTLVRSGNAIGATWTPPSSDGGRPVKGYLVATSDGEPLALVPAAAGSGVSFDWQADQAIEVNVAAFNEIGFGPTVAAVSEAVTKDPAVITDDPEIKALDLRVQARGKKVRIRRSGKTLLIKGYSTNAPATITAKVVAKPKKRGNRRAVRLVTKGKRMWVRTNGKRLKRVRLVVTASPTVPNWTGASWARQWKIDRKAQ